MSPAPGPRRVRGTSHIGDAAIEELNESGRTWLTRRDTDLLRRIAVRCGHANNPNAINLILQGLDRDRRFQCGGTRYTGGSQSHAIRCYWLEGTPSPLQEPEPVPIVLPVDPWVRRVFVAQCLAIKPFQVTPALCDLVLTHAPPAIGRLTSHQQTVLLQAYGLDGHDQDDLRREQRMGMRELAIRSTLRHCFTHLIGTLWPVARAAGLITDAPMDESTTTMWERIERTPTHWIWHGALDHGRVPVVKIAGKRYTVQRVLYATFVDAIPEGMHVARTCESHLCVNPDHLEVTRPGDSARTMQALHGYQ